MGTAEKNVVAVAIPRATFDALAGKSAQFREFIFKAYSRRITDLFMLIDDIVFQKMDVRLRRVCSNLPATTSSSTRRTSFWQPSLGPRAR